MIKFAGLFIASFFLVTPSQAQTTRTYWACIGQYEADCTNKTERLGRKLPSENWRGCDWLYATPRGTNENNRLGSRNM
jgi:hypothetical protein